MEVENIDEILAIFEWLEGHGIPYFILSGGTNVLVGDEGFAGMVIKMTNRDIIVKGRRFECGSGASMAKVVSLAASQSFSGLEWAAGLPGSVGGAIRGNAGCFGGSISGIVEIVSVLNLKKKAIENFSTKDCNFGYRTSCFKDKKADGYIILGATLKLEEGVDEVISETMFRNIKRRSAKQPKLPSAGSIFQNIKISDLKNGSELIELAEEAGVINDGMIPAGWLIDELGLRGKKIGGAKISMEHANFIVNTGQATAEDVVVLISIIKQKARCQFGVQLHEEIVYC